MPSLSSFDFRFSSLIVPNIILALVTASCAQKSSSPEPQAIHNWSQDNLSIVAPNGPNVKWNAFLSTALIPEDFSYRRSREEFNDGQGPIFEIDERNFETVRNIGVTSSFADFCKLDYEELNFLPLMQWQRSQLPKSARNGYEIYVLGVAHGYAMGKTDEWLETNFVDCTKFTEDMDGRFFSQVFGRKF